MLVFISCLLCARPGAEQGVTERTRPGPPRRGSQGRGLTGSRGRTGLWVPGWGGHKTGGYHPAGWKEEGPPSWPHLDPASAERTGHEDPWPVHSPTQSIEHNCRPTWWPCETGLKIHTLMIMTINSWSLDERQFINLRRLTRTSGALDAGPGDQGPGVEAPFCCLQHTHTVVGVPDMGMMTVPCHHRGSDSRMPKLEHVGTVQSYRHEAHQPLPKSLLVLRQSCSPQREALICLFTPLHVGGWAGVTRLARKGHLELHLEL